MEMKIQNVQLRTADGELKNLAFHVCYKQCAKKPTLVVVLECISHAVLVICTSVSLLYMLT